VYKEYEKKNIKVLRNILKMSFGRIKFYQEIIIVRFFR
jgi:hypothetical protein